VSVTVDGVLWIQKWGQWVGEVLNSLCTATLLRGKNTLSDGQETNSRIQSNPPAAASVSIIDEAEEGGG